MTSDVVGRASDQNKLIMGGDAKLLNLWFSLEDLLNSGPEWSLAGLGMYSVAEEELENMNICTVIRQ